MPNGAGGPGHEVVDVPIGDDLERVIAHRVRLHRLAALGPGPARPDPRPRRAALSPHGCGSRVEVAQDVVGDGDEPGEVSGG